MAFPSVVGLALIGAVLAVTLRAARAEYAMVLSLACGALLLLWAVQSVAPALEELGVMLEAARVETAHGEILLKALGVSFLTQLGADACRDAGESGIAGKVELCGRIAIVVLSLPMFRAVLTLAQSMFSL